MFGSIRNPRYLCSRTCPYTVPDGPTILLVEVIRISAQFLHKHVQNTALKSATAGPFTHFNMLFIACPKLHNPWHWPSLHRLQTHHWQFWQYKLFLVSFLLSIQDLLYGQQEGCTVLDSRNFSWPDKIFTFLNDSRLWFQHLLITKCTDAL
jgi:hypothetical protein